MSVAAAAVWPAIAVGQTIDSGDTAWMLTSTALVLFMTLYRDLRCSTRPGTAA